MVNVAVLSRNGSGRAGSAPMQVDPNTSVSRRGQTVNRLVGAGSFALTVLLLPAAVGGQEIHVGPNVHVSRAHADRAHYEIHLATDPRSHRHLVGGTMIWTPATSRYSVAAYTSTDGGATWDRTIEADLTSYANDPALAFAPDGTALLSYFGDAEPGRTQMFLHRSLDAGLTWQEPSTIYLMDRQWVTVDHTGGKYHGRVYIHGTRGARRLDGGSGVSGVSVIRSLDGGITFGPQVLLATSGSGYVLGMGNGAVLSDGTFLAVFGERLDGSAIAAGEPIPRAANAKLKVVSSNDGGERFSPASVVDDWFMRWGANTTMIPAMAADASGGHFHDRVYVVWPDYRSGRAEILLAYSRDSGKSWSRPRVVSDDHFAAAHGEGPDHFMPVVAVNPDGVVGVMWYDRRESADNMGWWARFSASLDGGETFLPSVRLATAPFEYTKEEGMVILGGATTDAVRSVIDAQAGVHHFNNKGGDTAGMVAAADGRFHGLWIDNRTGLPQIWTAPVTVNGRVTLNGDPALEGMQDLTSKLALELTGMRYDPRGPSVTMDAALRNTSTDTIVGELHARVLSLSSVFGLPTVRNADNDRHAAGAIWRFGSPSSVLVPGALSETRHLEFAIGGMRSLHPPAGARSNRGAHDLVRMKLRIVGLER
jgi:hypothetical protein